MVNKKTCEGIGYIFSYKHFHNRQALSVEHSKYKHPGLSSNENVKVNNSTV